MKPLISLSDLHKSFGDVEVLKGLEAEIDEGEFFSLLGPSGCGKTTLLRIIAGFEAPTSGRLLIDGRDMSRVPANKRPTNMVFQSYAVFPHLSVAQNVGFGLRRSGLMPAEKHKKIEEALAMVGLGGLGARAAQALSGGQRQRVALARALILEPKVLLLDEPLSALDKKLREQMQSELRRLQRQVGITFILVTHDQEEALIMSDRIAVMFDGQIAQLAPPQELYRRPVSRKVGDFIGVMNFLPADGRLEAGRDIVLDIAGLGRTVIAQDQCPAGFVNGSGAVGVRPESLQVLFDGEQVRGEVAQGEVAEVIYYGDMTYYEIALPDAPEPLTVSMKNRSGRPVLARGAAARLEWDASSLIYFPL